MDPKAKLRERCIELALAAQITDPKRVIEAARSFEQFILSEADRADRGDAPAA